MRPVTDFDAITADIAIWHSYDPAIKAEIYSTRLVTAVEAYLIDPIPLEKRASDLLIGSPQVAGIVVTNSNHHRAAAHFAEPLSTPIFAHARTFPSDTSVAAVEAAVLNGQSPDALRTAHATAKLFD